MLLGSSVSVPIQRYLLNMLCSCSGWTTLHSCVCYLLQEEGSAVEDSLALDFIQVQPRILIVTYLILRISSEFLARNRGKRLELVRILRIGGAGG